ncbi:phage baseplate upper protein [Enterococcus faecium]|uniref:BppU family phage baseplate upper protein n=1 Tax=Enterococcus faecium TaxID=1352 RepID=UPI001A248949|nr:BppU family phage baseplate upper protein [Enterococcus faecium]MCF8675572.1 phage baseplate upper protein [Enterococcus faecium]MCU2131290.1 phage baseplate upper protein [Enterococcus faecium]HAQ4491993.1 BppU family phage baseplate upper protein [Enterococcus faecium]HAQ4724521.1 BppU family phage baseplate upper protein [Enterococcus faecium]
MANLEIKLSANKRQPYLRHRVVGRVGDGGLTTINVQLLEEDEITPFVINLNGTLKFVGEVSNGNYTEGEPEIIDSTNGLISYTFTKSNFSTSHQFKQAYFEYVDPNGKKVTFQNFIIDVLERVDINSEQAKYYISSLEKLQSEMQTTFNQFISDKQVQYDQIYSKYNELVRLINESDKQVNDRIDQTNQQIGDLGKLKKMYSNSIDFGGYDYSGNPNISANLDASSFSSGTGATVVDDNDEIVFTLDGTNQFSKYAVRTQTPLVEGKQYTISCEIMLEDGFTGDPTGIRLQHAYLPGGIVVLQTETVPKNELNTWQKLIGTKTITYTSDVPNEWYPIFRDIRNLKPSGKVRLRNIKIEEGPTATPYQPNLLDDPYWLGKAPLGENIANKGTTFPIKSSAYEIYKGNTEEELIIGQTYTITLKGTKPASQTFVAYNYWNVNFGELKPVEGLTDVWSLTFTPTKLEPGLPKDLRIFQLPKETAGACQIDWLKIEKGDTRTPNISQFKYFGEGLKDSNNPNDYSWDITPEYTEKGLNDTVSLTEPQSIEGLKNFEDGIQSKGKSVLTSDDNKYEVVTLTVTNGNTGSAKLYREGKTVTIYFFALNGKSSGGNDSTILTIPEGYRPPISFEQLVGSIDRSTLNSAQLSIGADGAIKWRRNSSYGSAYSFVITYSI